MAGILKFSDAVSLGFHAMVILAESTGAPIRVKEAADELCISEAHLSKVMQRLGRQGLVRSTRGPGGGFRLARDASQISLLNVFEAIDGPLDESDCLLDKKVCNRERCIIGGLTSSVNKQIRKYLSDTTLEDLKEKRRD